MAEAERPEDNLVEEVEAELQGQLEAAEEGVEEQDSAEDRPEAEEAEETTTEEEESDPEQDLIDEFMADPLADVPEEQREIVKKTAQATFTKAQQRMAEALRKKEAEREEIAQKLADLQEKIEVYGKVQDTPSREREGPTEPPEDIRDDPEKLLDYLLEQKVSPLKSKLSEFETMQREAEKQRTLSERFQREGASLEKTYQELSDAESPETAAFQAWMQAHPEKVELWRNSEVITLEDLYAMSMAANAGDTEKRKLQARLAQKRQGATASTRPKTAPRVVKSWDEVTPEMIEEELKGKGG